MANREQLYGFHAVTAVLTTRPEDVLELFSSRDRDDARLQAVFDLAKQHQIKIQSCARKKLDSMVGDGEQHQGILAVCKVKPSYQEKDLLNLISNSSKSVLLLILDGIQDPRNLGACLRTANALGVDAVVIQKDRAASLTPVVRKVASGAAEITPIVEVSNLARTLRAVKEAGVWLVGTSDKIDTTIADVDLTGNIGIVMGSEGKGMRHLTEELCDFTAKIPMFGTVSSFNIAVASGICLYEVTRQRAR